VKCDDLNAIRERVAAAPKQLTATAHTYGPPVVMITCRTVRQAEAVAKFINHAPGDLRALLAALDMPAEPEQITMALDTLV
jgi:hypothetical protein